MSCFDDPLTERALRLSIIAVEPVSTLLLLLSLLLLLDGDGGDSLLILIELSIIAPSLVVVEIER